MIEDYKGILVVGEIYDGKIRPVTFQLITKARELAGILNTSLSTVLIGHNIGDMAKEPFYYGSEKVYVMDDPIFNPYVAEVYSKALSKFIGKLKPEIVLIPATHTGREYGPRIAAALETGMTADCTDLVIKNGRFVQVRPAYGGNIMGEIFTPNHRPQIATVRPNVFKAGER